MYRFKYVRIALALFAGLVLGIALSRITPMETTAEAQVSAAQKWETMVIRGGNVPEGLQGVMNMRGEEGWELADVVETKQGGFVAYMKRPK